MALTQKQENFCLAYLETGNASEAYRASYNASKMKTESVNRAAKDLTDNPKIAARMKELRKPIMERHNVTIDSLLAELEEARQAALGAEAPQSSAAVSATMGKAKLCGLEAPKKIEGELTVQGRVQFVPAKMDIDDETG